MSPPPCCRCFRCQAVPDEAGSSAPPSVFSSSLFAVYSFTCDTTPQLLLILTIFSPGFPISPGYHTAIQVELKALTFQGLILPSCLTEATCPVMATPYRTRFPLRGIFLVDQGLSRACSCHLPMGEFCHLGSSCGLEKEGKERGDKWRGGMKGR